MENDTTKSKTIRDIISRYGLPSEGLISDIENTARLVSIGKGEPIVSQGKVCSDIVFYRSGLFRVCHACGNTEDTVLFGAAGDVFTSFHSYYAKEPSIFSVIAIEKAEVWMISYPQWRNLEIRHPELIAWMRDLLVEQMFGFEKRYLFFNNKSAQERFDNFLNIHSEILRRPSVKSIYSKVPLKYIAQYLKITQSTLSRLRKKIWTRKP